MVRKSSPILFYSPKLIDNRVLMADEKSFEENKKRAIKIILVVVVLFVIIVVISLSLGENEPDPRNPSCGNGFVEADEECDNLGCPPNYVCNSCSCVREKSPENGTGNDGGNGTVPNDPDEKDGNASVDENEIGGGIGPGIGPPTPTPGGSSDDTPTMQACSVSAEITGTVCPEESCFGELIGECCVGVCLREGAGFTECFNTCIQNQDFSQAECEVLCSPS